MTNTDEFNSYEAFSERLKTKYPEMYGNVYCGISINTGWQRIIESLSANIDFYVKYSKVDYPKVAQIKEKFGELRFYYDGGDERIHGMVRMAESWASNTCEICGKSGKLRHGGWMKTLCDEHEEIRQNAYKGN